jgi:rSAM/selenodomain-associated transferase 2
MIRISIIIPVLNEASQIRYCLSRLQSLRGLDVELIVVDGGSVDATVECGRPLVDLVLVAPRGRGSQMNCGAGAATGHVLLFLHADTQLPDHALESIRNCISTGFDWGRFDVCIQGSLSGLSMVAFLMNLRSRLTGICTGDQAIFVTRERFNAVGCYPDIPLMEDIALCRGLRRTGRPACLTARVVTSGRRWEQNGVWRTIGKMWWLRLRYFLGADPVDLAREYGYLPRTERGG